MLTKILLLLVTQLHAAVSLQEAFKASLTKNESVLQGREQVNQADNRVTQLRGGILPNLSFNAQHVLQDEPADPTAREFAPRHQTTVNFTVTQPLFRGLREFAGLNQIKHLRTAQEAAQAQLETKLFQDVAASYLQILGYEKDLENLRDQADIYQKRVSELQARAKRGESNQTDVISAQATQASLAAEIRLIEGQHKVARENLHFLTGLPADAELADPNLSTWTKIEAVDKYLARVDQRPDVKAALERYEANDSAVSVAWGAHLPTVDAVGNYYLKRPGFFQDITWDIGVKLTFPIFEGLATQAKISEAVSRRKEAELDLAKTRRAAAQEIRSLHEKLRARYDHLTNLKKAAELSKKNAELMQRDYRRGLARNIDVQLALTEGRVAQRGYDQAYFAAQLEMYQLQTSAALVPAVSKDN